MSIKTFSRSSHSMQKQRHNQKGNISQIDCLLLHMANQTEYQLVIAGERAKVLFKCVIILA